MTSQPAVRGPQSGWLIPGFSGRRIADRGLRLMTDGCERYGSGQQEAKCQTRV
jgi:hypothetical protein